MAFSSTQKSRSCPHKVLFFGHSLTKHLSTYVKQCRPNFGFSKEELDLQFIGVGGLRISQLLENPERLVLIKRFAKVMPRNTESGTSGYLFDGYNHLAWTINNLLLEAVRGIQHVSMFNLKWSFPQEKELRFNNLVKSGYAADGVHLSRGGLKKMLIGFRAIIIAALNNRLH